MTEFTPTHTVPDSGLQAWDTPDPAARPVATLVSRLPVQILDRSGDWAYVRCSNGWQAWTDARPLVTMPAPPTPMTSEKRVVKPRAGGKDRRTEPSAGTLIDAALVSRMQAALAAYLSLLGDLEAKRIDGSTFRSAAFRTGLIARDDDVWMWDVTGGCWHRYDGVAVTKVEMEPEARPT